MASAPAWCSGCWPEHGIVTDSLRRSKPTTGVLGSNQDSGPDDRDRKDDDHQVDGEPLRYVSHSLVLCDPYFVPKEDGQM